MYLSDLTTFRVTFDDTCPANGQKSTWLDKSAPNNQESLDPILFTDHAYNRTNPTVGRTFASQLTGQDSLTSYTDDDGDTWVPSQGGGIPSGVDHQAIGAGQGRDPAVVGALLQLAGAGRVLAGCHLSGRPGRGQVENAHIRAISSQVQR